MTRGWGKTRHCFFEPFQMSTINDMVLRWGSAGAVGGPRPSGPISAPPPQTPSFWPLGRRQQCSGAQRAVQRPVQRLCNVNGVGWRGGGVQQHPQPPQGAPTPTYRGGGVSGVARVGGVQLQFCDHVGKVPNARSSLFLCLSSFQRPRAQNRETTLSPLQKKTWREELNP